MIEITFKGHRNGPGKHYVTLSRQSTVFSIRKVVLSLTILSERIDLLDGETQAERTYMFLSSTKMEIDKSYVLQLV